MKFNTTEHNSLLKVEIGTEHGHSVHHATFLHHAKSNILETHRTLPHASTVAGWIISDLGCPSRSAWSGSWVENYNKCCKQPPLRLGWQADKSSLHLRLTLNRRNSEQRLALEVFFNPQTQELPREVKRLWSFVSACLCRSPLWGQSQQTAAHLQEHFAQVGHQAFGVDL